MSDKSYNHLFCTTYIDGYFNFNELLVTLELHRLNSWADDTIKRKIRLKRSVY